MPIIKRPQPPGDSGSRKKLTGRKGDIESVEHAYSGIVNVYALRPHGSSPISIKEFTGGIVEIPPSATIYSQKNKPIAGPRGPGNITYAWKHDSHEKVDKLYELEDGAIKGVVDPYRYDSILAKNPTLVKSYNEDSPDVRESINRARMIVVKKPSGSDQYNKIMFKQAMRMHVPISKMKYWVEQKYSTIMNVENVFKKVEAAPAKAIKELIERIIETDDTDPSAREVLKRKYNLTDAQINAELGKAKGGSRFIEERLEAESTPKKQSITVVDVSKFPIPLDVIQKLPDNAADFMPVDKESAKKIFEANPDRAKFQVKYKLTSSGVEYYIPKSLMSATRRRKMQKTKVKRIIYRLKKASRSIKSSSKKVSNSNKVKCSSRSSMMKKGILKNLKCKCRRK